MEKQIMEESFEAKSEFEMDYKYLIEKILEIGSLEENRTKSKAITLFGEELIINMSNGLLPIVTGKKIFFDKAYHEYFWILSGCTTIHYLNNHNINWWDQYADSNGYLGKTYGYQLRNYNGEFDQLFYVERALRVGSRRAHITLWNPCELDETALPCCYTGLTFVITENKLNLAIDFRSSDAFLGLPYDIIFGALFLKDMASTLNLNTGFLKLNLNNVHIYENNVDQAKQYLKTKTYKLPCFPKGNKIKNYNHGPYIKAPLNN